MKQTKRCLLETVVPQKPRSQTRIVADGLSRILYFLCMTLCGCGIFLSSKGRLWRGILVQRGRESRAVLVEETELETKIKNCLDRF